MDLTDRKSDKGTASPDDARALNDRGNAFRQRGCLDEALESYEAALALVPDYGAALYNRSNVLLELGRASDALVGFDRVLALSPDDKECLTLRGGALAHLGRHEEALASHDRALALDPEYVPALHGSANAALALGQPHEALAKYDRVLAAAPDHFEALCQRGNALLDLRRFHEALASYERALLLDPNSSGVLMNRGNVLLELARPEDALASYERALAIDPRFADALNNRGTVLQQLRRYDEAAQSFAELLTVAPEYAYALGHLVACRLRNCDWNGYDDLTERLKIEVGRGARAATPFVFLGVSNSAAAQLRCARTYAEHKCAAPRRPVWTGQRYRHDRIRIAYLSADLRDHAVAHLLADVFETHDRQRFETSAISFGHDIDDAMRQRLRSAFDRFLDVQAKDDREVAEILHTLEIDIAVDLMGYTTYSRPGILAFRPAPVQVSYLGFAGTMGATHIDYIVADRVVIPADAQAHYTERVVCLPGTFFPSRSRPPADAQPRTRADFGLPPSGFVFCSFNNNYKISPAVFEIWMRLLKRVEGSVLWLLGDSATVQANLRREATTRGVSAERLIFAKWASTADYHARYRLADLFLDTLPYNAHTTASDALRSGLPVLTCIGTTFPGRVAGSLLCALGMPELVTTSPDEYEALALKLATDSNLLDQTSGKLRASLEHSPIFDTERFRCHLERAYIGMWERSQRGEAPASFDVEP